MSASNLKLLGGTFLILLTLPMTTYGQSPTHPAASLPVPLSHFTESELHLAASLGAEEAYQMQLSSTDGTSTKNLTVLSSVESVDDNFPNSRLALVTSYSYDRNVTIRRLVDLNQNTVVTEHVVDDSSAPLAVLEKSIVQHLVLQDNRIADLLGNAMNDVSVEMLLTSTYDPEDRFFRKRVVMALFKTSHGYVRNMPKVLVNLSDEEVVVGE